MIGAVVMIFIAMWIYRTAMKDKIMWTAAAAVVFFAVQFALIEVNVNMFDLDGSKTESKVMKGSSDEACEDDKATNTKAGEKDSDMGQFKDTSCSVVHGSDRQDEERYQGFGGILKSLYFELSPQLFSFLLIAFLRLKFITKEELNVTNLFSGLKEMFAGIKQSFTSPQ